MEEKLNEQTEPKTQSVETGDENLGVREGEVSLGKFKDVNALYNAYNSLQSEFTKRCQKLKELENKLAVQSEKQAKTVETEQEKPKTEQDITLQNKEQILKDYLYEILGKKSNSIVMDGAGVGVKTPVSRPKTFEEAGQLAKQLFKN